MAKPRVAVFGAGGFSGRHFERFVATESLGESYEFFGHTRDPNNAEQTGAVSYRQGDPTRKDEVAAFIVEVQPDYILNLVGKFRGEGMEDFFQVHLGVSHAICEAALQADHAPQKIVLVGSAAEYGVTADNPVREDAPAEPINWYGLSKLYQTHLALYYARNHALPVVVARTFNILGEGLSADLSIGSFDKQIQALPDGGTIKVGNLETSRDFLDIAEVSRRYWTLLMHGQPGEIYNICSGAPRTIRSVLDDLIEQSGKRLAVEVDTARLKGRDVAAIYGDPSKFDRLGA